MKTLTPYNKANEREIEMMVSKAMCAYANWQDYLKVFNSAGSEYDNELARRQAIAFKSEYEATGRILEMFVKENIYTIQQYIRDKAKAEFPI